MSPSRRIQLTWFVSVSGGKAQEAGGCGQDCDIMASASCPVLEKCRPHHPEELRLRRQKLCGCSAKSWEQGAGLGGLIHQSERRVKRWYVDGRQELKERREEKQNPSVETPVEKHFSQTNTKKHSVSLLCLGFLFFFFFKRFWKNDLLMFIKLLLNEGHSGAVGNSRPERSHFPDIVRREGECAGAGGGRKRRKRRDFHLLWWRRSERSGCAHPPSVSASKGPAIWSTKGKYFTRA